MSPHEEVFPVVNDFELLGNSDLVFEGRMLSRPDITFWFGFGNHGWSSIFYRKGVPVFTQFIGKDFPFPSKTGQQRLDLIRRVVEEFKEIIVIA